MSQRQPTHLLYRCRVCNTVFPTGDQERDARIKLDWFLEKYSGGPKKLIKHHCMDGQIGLAAFVGVGYPNAGDETWIGIDTLPEARHRYVLIRLANGAIHDAVFEWTDGRPTWRDPRGLSHYDPTHWRDRPADPVE